MPLFLKKRDTQSKERMDDALCPPLKLENTYRQFSIINSIISQWKKIYNKFIFPFARNRQTSILDIGFGGGDIPIKLACWASKDELDLQITAIDPDIRAYNFVQKLDYPENITFRHCSVSDLNPNKQKYDFVISNHLLHHLSQKELSGILGKSKNLSRRAVIFNDIERSDIGYLLFNVTWPFFRNSYITEDGLTSVKRSYTYEELSKVVSQGWQVEKLFPFRLLLLHEHT